MSQQSAFVVGVDIGGTFTDCVCATQDGQTYIGKAPSTPPHFERGFVDSLGVVAKQLGLTTAEFLPATAAVYHGCTVGTNALIEGRTAKVGLIATAGHGESLSLMQGGGRLLNMPAEYIAHVAGHDKPAPLVPPALIREVPERVTFAGDVLAPLDQASAEGAVRSLVAEGAEAFAVALLWSVVNPDHERVVAGLIRQAAPEAYVSLSSEVIPKTGEFQRSVATVINSLVGPVMESYLSRLTAALESLGFVGAFEVMSCSGGLVSGAEARHKPILTIGSGPVAGLVGARQLSSASTFQGGPATNLLTLDMGGTTADVGVMPGGEPLLRSSNWFGQYEYFVPRLDVRSIGVGGGSIVRYDLTTQTLKVGPQSAGAEPGPASYGRGGSQATMTDADLVLGLLNPEYFLGGSIKLDVGAAREALARVGASLGFSSLETAAAAARIADSQMADAIRLASIGEGLDPRTFVLCAYGGGGPAHAGAIARELGIGRVVVPLGDLAAGWSAFGVARSNALTIEERPMARRAPFDMPALVEVWGSLEGAARDRLAQRGVPEIVARPRATLKYELQTYELTIDVELDELAGLSSDGLVGLFGAEYERLYGEGTGYGAAGVALTALSVNAQAAGSAWQWSHPGQAAGRTEPHVKEVRGVVWYELGVEFIPTNIYDGSVLAPGMAVQGPAVIELPNTTVAVRPLQTAVADEGGNVVIHLSGGSNDDDR